MSNIHLNFTVMKTKNTLRTMLTIVTGLMLILTPVLSRSAVQTDLPETNYRLSELIIYNDDGNSRQVYTYDDCDRLVSLLEQNEIDDSWVDVELSTYTYDAFGNVLTKYFENFEW
jgi:hypothetical protein